MGSLKPRTRTQEIYSPCQHTQLLSAPPALLDLMRAFFTADSGQTFFLSFLRQQKTQTPDDKVAHPN